MNLVLLGPPGAGKGTQAKVLSEKLKLKHISTGDLLRKNVAEKTHLGQLAKDYMEKGALVPDELVNSMLKEEIKGLNSKGFILDGYPRNINQAKKLEELLSEVNLKLDRVIYLDVDDSTVIERLSGRLVCSNCGANFHLKNMPPKKENICDFCGSRLIQRSDDKEETIKERLKIYKNEVAPILDFYKERNLLVFVNANLDAKSVLNKILEILNDSYKDRRRTYNYA